MAKLQGASLNANSVCAKLQGVLLMLIQYALDEAVGCIANANSLCARYLLIAN